MPLVIVHREPGNAAISGHSRIWRTCLREVEFVDEAESCSNDERRLEEGAAYEMLLEILCGLQSPMIGETQVLGQFKSFLSTLDRGAASVKRVGQQLLMDAREIRAKYLQGLGSRSYGSAIRRDLDGCAQAVLIGTGKLAGEVLPFLLDGGRHVDQWGRAASLEIADGVDVAYASLANIEDVPVAPVPTALVIAAPVSVEVIELVAARYSQVRRIVDLRADVGERALQTSASVVSLQQLFDRMVSARHSSAPQIAAARADIALRRRRFETRSEPRPFGWDDLCA